MRRFAILAAVALVAAILSFVGLLPRMTDADGAGACHVGIHFYVPALGRYLAADRTGRLAVTDPAVNAASLFRVCQTGPATFAAESNRVGRWVAVTPGDRLAALAGGPGPHELYTRACRGPLVFWRFPSVGQWAELEPDLADTVWATALFDDYGLGFMSNDGACH